MKMNAIKTLTVLLIILSAFILQAGNFSLKVKVNGLRNSKGVVVFALYNKDKSIPDEHFKHYYLKQTAEIKNNSSATTFENLPEGKYAVSILHDENKNGIIDKGFVLPVEGVGFSNYQSIGLTNRPKFKNASILLNSDKELTVKVIYF
jgi:uncharacterized protein (DUF2141 family)